MSWRSPTIRIYESSQTKTLTLPITKYFGDRHAHFVADTHKNGHPNHEKIASFINDLQSGFQKRIQLVKDEVLAKQTEIFVKESLGELNWDYSTNKPDSSCYPPALADVISCLSRLAYDFLRPATKPKRKRDIKSDAPPPLVNIPTNSSSKRMKIKRPPNKPKRKSGLIIKDSSDIALQLNMMNVFQKTSKYRNEPHRSNMMKAIISVTRGIDSARQAGRKFKVSARSIGRYIHVLKEMRAKNPIPSLNSSFSGASGSAIATAFRPSATPLNQVTSAPKVKDGTDAVAQEFHSPSDVYAAEKLLVLLAAGASGTKTVQAPASASVVAMTHREAAPPPKKLEKNQTSNIGDNSVNI